MTSRDREHARTRRPPGARRKLLVVLLAPPLVFAVLEFAARAAGVPPAAELRRPEDLPPGTSWGAGDLHQTDAVCLWVPRPGAELHPGERVNELAMRGPVLPRERRPGVARVALVGESALFGFGVPYADTLAGRLPDALARDDREVEVLNGAVSGHTVWQGLARYTQELRAWRPDVVVAAFGVVNEHKSALDGDDLTRLARARAQAGALHDAASFLRRHSRAVSWFERALADASDASNNADFDASPGFRRRLGRVDFPGERRVSLPSFEQGLNEFADAVAADGVALVFVSMARIPYLEEFAPVLGEYSAALERVAAERALPLVAYRAWLREHAPDTESADPYFVPGSLLHPSVLGHARLTELVAPAVDAVLTARAR